MHIVMRLNPDRWSLMLCLVAVATFDGARLCAQSNTSAASSGAAPTNTFGSRSVRAHDPSTMIRCGNEYWVFHTGRGILSYRSADLIKWEPGPRVFAEAPDWVSREVPENRNTHFWAPDVIRVNDQYLLYYSVSSFGKNTSAIGLVTSPTLDPAASDFKWTDRGIVVQSFATNDFNAIDPAVTQDAEGKLWLSFGSFWSGIKLIPLDAKTGLRQPGSAMYALARNDSIEAPFIFHHDGYYYLFVNWGICCRGVNSTYEIRVGRSGKITGPYLDGRGVDMLNEGGDLLLQSQPPFIGPGHPGILVDKTASWFSCHFYDGARRGMPTLSIQPLSWSNGWPRIGTATDGPKP
jgi:arabinan endo-1,5-alpha-L-arabinosidase